MSLVYGEPVPPLVVPTILTARLELTGWTAADLDAYLDMAVHQDMSRWTSSPGDAGSVWRMFTYQVGHWALRGYGMWLAHERDTGEFVGRVGLYEEHGWPGLEVAWTIRRDRWGRGLAVGTPPKAAGRRSNTRSPLSDVTGPSRSSIRRTRHR